MDTLKFCEDGTLKRLLDGLVGLGLDKHEAMIYLTLISEGTVSARKISDVSGIPNDMVYEIVDVMAGKGFCVVLPTHPMKCIAVSPRDMLEKAKSRMELRFDNFCEDVSVYLEPLFEKEEKVWSVN